MKYACKNPPKKSLGQNFLINRGAIISIVQAIGLENEDTAVEIGPGNGELSLTIVKNVNDYYAIELDDTLFQNLCQKLPDELAKNIFREDGCTFEFDKLFTKKKLLVFGNLPYSSASKILIHLCDYYTIIKKVVVLVQKEVAHRICAEPGSKDYGMLTITVQNAFQCHMNFDIPPECFYPKPKVVSTLITMMPREITLIPAGEQQRFLNMCKKLFQQRRKTMFNLLRKQIAPQLPDQTHKKILLNSSISESARTETLSIQKLFKLHQTVTKELVDNGHP